MMQREALVVAAETQGSWSHCILRHESERDEHMFSVCFLLIHAFESVPYSSPWYGNMYILVGPSHLN